MRQSIQRLLGVGCSLLLFAGLANAADIPLQSIPLFLQRAVITAEDKRFFEHAGSDRTALVHAVVQNIWAGRMVRGGSTITEQLVRLEHRFPRTISGRLQSARAAIELEERQSKDQILEQYLNRISFPSNATGVAEAARLLFGRDLSTLSSKEMLALAVLIRAPSGLDPRRNDRGLERRIQWLAQRMAEAGLLDASERAKIAKQPLQILLREEGVRDVATFRSKPSTVDVAFEQRCTQLLRTRIHRLRGRNVQDGALLALDNKTGEVIAEVSISKAFPGIDAARVPRQPGSALKPFLYSLALERGWTAQTVLQDSPLLVPVGSGVHRFRNYSGQFFGPVTLTEALGSSLNVPAIRTIQFVGPGAFLERLRALGFSNLNEDASHYGEGLALGNGEVTLHELVRAYLALANNGVFRDPAAPGTSTRIMPSDAAEKITAILVDPDARRHEFGTGGLLAFPIETAVKTGTSNDHHDAWAVGYSARYTVGVWMGNLDRTPMREVSGSRGPAWVLRATFAALERRGEPRELVTARVETPTAIPAHVSKPLRITSPTPELTIRRDPRIPDELEAIAFQIDGADTPVEWSVDGKLAGTSSLPAGKFLWKIAPGSHVITASLAAVAPGSLPPVSIHVR